jgi:hypothetical protein
VAAGEQRCVSDGQERYGMKTIGNGLLDIYQRGGCRGYVTRARVE